MREGKALRQPGVQLVEGITRRPEGWEQSEQRAREERRPRSAGGPPIEWMGLPLAEKGRQQVEQVCRKDREFDFGCAEGEMAVSLMGM